MNDRGDERGMDTGITERSVDVLIVGAGPAGLAAAVDLARTGAGTIEVIEREPAAGGIPRHSHHVGYGLRDLHRVMTGPAYARHYAAAAEAAGARIRTGITVTDWAGPPPAAPGPAQPAGPAAYAPAGDDPATFGPLPGAHVRAADEAATRAGGPGAYAPPRPAVLTTGPGGLERISARAVLLATGARERPRSARLVPGDRPAGVYTTGQLQQEVHLRHQRVGRRALIVGAEHVSYSAALTLRHAGAEVRALLTALPRQQSYTAFHLGMRLGYGVPVLTGHAVTAVLGHGRVRGVRVRRPDGTEAEIACDTVVFTGDWIPDHELARRAGLEIDPGTRGPAVTADLATSAPGVFAAGNLVHPVETADNVALSGRAAARSVLAYLDDPAPPPPGAVAVHPAGAVRWAAPNRLHPATRVPRDRLIIWAATVAEHPHIEIRQAGRVLWSARRHRPLVPGSPYHLPTRWLPDVEPYAGPVEITAG